MRGILFVTALCLFNLAAGQTLEFGLKAGANFSKFDNLGDGLLPGLAAGLYSSYQNKKVEIRYELIYSEQGEVTTVYFHSTPNPAPVTSLNLKKRINYVNVPILFRYKLPLGFNVQAGGQIGILVSARQQTGSTNGGLEWVDINSTCAKSVYSLIGGIGYSLPKGMTFDLRYDFGLNCAVNYASYRNRVVQFSVGFPLFKKTK